MSIDLWLTFALSYAAFSAIPGPSVLMATGQTLAHGVRTGLRCVLGDLMGGIMMMSLGFAGLGAILALSDLAFAVVKWAGVAYLVVLGLRQLWRAGQDRATGPAKGFQSGLLVGVLNPKANGFFLAFTAQFIDPALPGLPQFLTLGLTAFGVAGLVLSAYVLLAGRIGARWRDAAARKRADQAGGAMMIGGGVWMALRG